MAATLSNELLLEILGGTANSSSRVETRELDRASPELLALLRGLASRTTQDRDKLKFYKSSFSTLTTHLNLLTTRLTTVETGLQAQTIESSREAEKNREQVDAFRMLSKVWESRWREERREKEELELEILKGQDSALNQPAIREEARITVYRSPIKPTKARRRSPSSSSSSSSESRRDTSRRLDVTPVSTRTPTKLSSKQVIAELSRELERVRRDGGNLVRERDDQIDRLQHERQLRKTELKDVYNSFDTLLGLGGAVEVGTKVDALTEETTPRPKAIKVKSRRAARLKAEVQEMEEEVARLLSEKANPPISDVDERLLLSSSLQILDSNISQLQADLREGLYERDMLRKSLFGSAVDVPSLDTLGSSNDRRRLQLENANEQLLVKLTASIRESAALQTQLDESEITFEGIAQRVRDSMIRKQDDLRDASRRIDELEEKLARTDRS